ncbi:hypothetical protein ABIB83_001279 [Bradyrhizobium sp. I1.8.5]
MTVFFEFSIGRQSPGKQQFTGCRPAALPKRCRLLRAADEVVNRVLMVAVVPKR